MKRLLWMLVAVAVLGFGVSTLAKDKTAGGEKGKVTINGTLKVDGEKLTLAGDDGTTYVLKSKSEKTLADLKAKDGQKIELKGKVTEEDGTKTLTIAGKGGGKKKDAAPAPATGDEKK